MVIITVQRLIPTASLAFLGLFAGSAQSEVILQYFETRWDEIYQRLPEIAEIGYESVWTPPPGKSPIGGNFPFAYGGNVGYNSFDRFDLGDMPQRGSWETRYGSRTSLRNMVDNAHQCGIKIYPDIVFNHAGNGPDYRTYPGMVPEDFHVWKDAGQPGGYKRAPRMSVWTPDNGYGGTLNQELVSLMDINLEFDGRFQTGAPNYVADPTPFIRQPGDYDKYPYNATNSTLPTENSRDFIVRWINWLGYAMDYDGVRLDAPKHVYKDFFGLPNQATSTRDKTFIYNIQKNFRERRGLSTSITNQANPFPDLYANDLRRENAMVFSEFFIGGIGDVDYWRNPADRGWGIQSRYLNFPLKSQMMASAFSGGNLGALATLGVSFDPGEAVNFVQSHDEAPLSKLELSYAYILTHIGVPVVYFSGNNLKDSEIGRQAGKNTWLNKGYDGALGDYGMGSIPNLIYIHNQFCRGSEYTRWSENDFFAYERYQDLNSNGAPNSGEGLILVALNDSGNDQTRGPIQTSFAAGTKLKDYSGKNADIVTVAADGTVSIRVPGSSGQGWVCYAPFNADAPTGVDPLQFSGTGVATIPWVVPGGRDAAAKPRNIVRLTGNTVTIDIYYSNPAQGGETVDNVLLKWGQGADINGNGSIDFNGKDIVTGGFESTTRIADGHYRATASLTNIPEGLHTVQARVFNGRTGKPALFQTFAETVYVDRRGPDLEFSNLAAGDTVKGGRVITINNPDRTLYNLTYTLDGGPSQQADMVIRGKWRVALDGLTSGSHTLTLNATEADYGSTRSVINTSTLARSFTVDTSGPSISLSHAAGALITEPFFKTTVSVPAGTPTNNVKLYWNGYEQPAMTENPSGSGKFESYFTGRYREGGADKIFTGAFINGPHFFEASVTSGSQENRVARKVVFNLYNQSMQDSDGDGIPDDIELSGFLNGTNPGPDQNWPGDNSQDLIPNYGETWTRLNAMSADTDYVGTWDGDVDSDGDGVSNLQEVIRSYRTTGNPYSYNIYSAASVPPATATSAATSTLSTSGTNRVVNFTYRPNEGPLSGQSPIRITITPTGTGSPQTVTMNAGTSGDFSATYTVPTGVTSVSYSFSNSSGTVTDTTGASAWTTSTVPGFTMDGAFDSSGFKVVDNGMVIYAAVRGTKLYTATWSPTGGSNDHFIFITDQFGDPRNHPWAKAGQIYFDSTTKPWLAANNANYINLSNGGADSRNFLGASGGAMECELDLAQAFGSVPTTLYLAVGAWGRSNGSALVAQAPVAWDADNNIQITEFQPLNTDSIRDENLDGVFDVGIPEMKTVVAGNEADGNYGLRRFYLDELVKDEAEITVKFKPNASPNAVLLSPEVFTNLNRRDYAVMEEDPSVVTTSSSDTYYRAYPMTGPDASGYYSKTLKVNRCGAYRLQVRYKLSGVNNGNYIYYTDHAQRRDCAIVVSPKKALNLTMYEVNPSVVEAKDATESGRSTFLDLVETGGYNGRPDVLNQGHYSTLGINMIWLQPIHPIGQEGQTFSPGSPYAVRDYWSVNPSLGRSNTSGNALSEFQTFVSQMDAWNVGVMMDGTFNHCAPDAIMGQGAVDLGLPYSAGSKIREANYRWFAKEGYPGQVAGNISEIAIAPDRNDFGNWTDVREFFFGSYDALVKAKGTYNPTTTTYPDNANRQEFLLERDEFAGHTPTTREVWQYFSYYPIYWLEKTGHPKGTPKSQSYKGIDGLRCDFAQGLPSQFWEYTINKTRSLKWDFLFMAESLDGFKEVNGNKRHGVGYRSARHFDILNENSVFYWRGDFFGYDPNGGAGTPKTPTTYNTWKNFDDRRQAFDGVTLLNNLVSHDEVLPHNDPYRILYAYAQVAAIDGTPMILYGQEGGLQNSKTGYAASEANFGTINANRNFANYETNFGKVIPNFKSWNHMTNLWASRDWTVQDLYGRINRARLNSPALRSPNVYFLSTTAGGYSDNVFAVAKYQQGDLNAGQQDVVFAFVNNRLTNSFMPNNSSAATFSVNATNSSGANWFGIQSSKTYNVRDLLSTNTNSFVWSTARTGTDLLANGLYVGLPYEGRQAHYLKLVEVNSTTLDTDGDGLTNDTDPDDDNDGIPDTYEIANGMNPLVTTGADGASGDKDGDGLTNYQEYLAGTKANDATSALGVSSLNPGNGQSVTLTWNSIPGAIYQVRYSGDLTNWIDFPGGLITAEGTTTSVNAVPPQGQTYSKLFFRVNLVP